MEKVILPSDGIGAQLRYPAPPVGPKETPLTDVMIAPDARSAIPFPALRNLPLGYVSASTKVMSTQPLRLVMVAVYERVVFTATLALSRSEERRVGKEC